MTSSRIWGLAVAALCAAGCASDPAPVHTEPSEEEMMAAWMEYMTPGEEHARMAAQCGEWTVNGKMWESADSPVTEFTGTATFSMILEGHYQMQEYSGDIMGMTFHGRSITGYDNALKRFQGIWIDTAGTGVTFTEGVRDMSGRVTTTGLMTAPDGSRLLLRDVLIDVDDDHFTLEMYAEEVGKEEFQMMELNYTRMGK